MSRTSSGSSRSGSTSTPPLVKGKDTALFVVEARVRRLFPF